MSTQQIQRCVRDVLGMKDDGSKEDWTTGNLKKISKATSTLYHASLYKVMLKQDEESARCHICAYIASERISEKYDTDMLYYLDRIPMEPKKVRSIVELFKQNIFQTSPVKRFNWTPSPKKKPRSNLKGNDRFTSQNPDELRKQLFNTPTKVSKSEATTPIHTLMDSSKNIVTPKTRRRLAFEEDIEDDEKTLSPLKGTQKLKRPKTLSQLSRKFEASGNDDDDESFFEDEKKGDEKEDDEYSADDLVDEIDGTEDNHQRRGRGRPRKDHTAVSKPKTQHNRHIGSLLQRKHFKIKTNDIISVCNQFEIPKDTAYNILHQFMELSTFLQCPWQLLCGLIINCTFIVHNEKRRKDPRIDHMILERMCLLMKTSDVSEVLNCIKTVKEVIVGENWFRNLQIKYDNFDGAHFQEAIAARLGSMLQSNNILASDEQYNNWRRKIDQDISLRTE